jgi:energy-coupling factor transporter ATP-binding protein EcfA2
MLRTPTPRLRRLRLRNIRCFEEVDIDFTDPETGFPVSWAVILGDNSSGKSTVLKAIALALASLKDANALFESDSRSEWLRKGAIEGSIEVELDHGPRRLEIVRESYGERIDDRASIAVQSSVMPGEEPMLVCGYGASRRSFGTQSHRGYSVRGAVATLFDPDAPLQNPELSLRRLASSSVMNEADLLHRIDHVLDLPDGATQLGPEGLEIRGPWGTFLPVSALSDGYRATLSWILDFLGWALLRDRGVSDGSFEGLVLLDEIEQHLHPRWQKRILGQLSRQFPGIQFVVTTHAPLCVTGTTDLEDSEVNLVHLGWNGPSVEARGGLKPPRGQRADQILTSYLFGLTTTTDDRTKQQIHRLSELLSRNPQELEPADHQEIERLRADLDSQLGPHETRLEAETAGIVDQALDEVLKDRVQARLEELREESGSTAAADFEARRQLKKLLEPTVQAR